MLLKRNFFFPPYCFEINKFFEKKLTKFYFLLLFSLLSNFHEFNYLFNIASIINAKKQEKSNDPYKLY